MHSFYQKEKKMSHFQGFHCSSEGFLLGFWSGETTCGAARLQESCGAREPFSVRSGAKEKDRPTALLPFPALLELLTAPVFAACHSLPAGGTFGPRKAALAASPALPCSGSRHSFLSDCSGL